MSRSCSAALAIALVLAVGMVVPVHAQSAETRKALERYRELRPSADELAMYRLDWAASFEEGRERAAKEKRPHLVVVIHARYGDLFTGHC